MSQPVAPPSSRPARGPFPWRALLELLCELLGLALLCAALWLLWEPEAALLPPALLLLWLPNRR